jgi:aryl-alcohol dehydrogenase-like predicted oxidoreductase
MMQTRPLGASNIPASVIGLGTWGIGGWQWGGTNEAAAIDAIHAALDAGVTLIDTAPAYGLGLSEEIVGKALVGKRDRAIVATKCGLVWHTGEGSYFFTENDRPVHRYLGAASLRHEVEASLRRLQTDRIDLYQTHWQDPVTPIAETMETLLDLKREGKIRAIGVSNVNTKHLDDYRAFGTLDSAQEQYNMLDRQIETDLLPYTRTHQIAMLAYSPLALGILTGKIGAERQFSGDDLRIGNPRFSIENRARVAALLADFQPIAERHQITLTQLVIAWTAAQPGITHVLVGARNRQQALENVAAGAVTLSAADLQQIDQALAQHHGALV